METKGPTGSRAEPAAEDLALRDGNTVLAVLTPTDDRKDRAAQILKECGGRFINFFGRLNVERITR